MTTELDLDPPPDDPIAMAIYWRMRRIARLLTDTRAPADIEIAALIGVAAMLEAQRRGVRPNLDNQARVSALAREIASRLLEKARET